MEPPNLEANGANSEQAEAQGEDAEPTLDETRNHEIGRINDCQNA